MKVWQCTVCKYIHEGDAPPEKCPVCGVPAEKFVEIDQSQVPEKKTGSKVGAGRSESGSKPAPRAEETPESQRDTTLLEKLEAFLCRMHAHPVSVHTPNGILPAAVLLWVLAWYLKNQTLDAAALINLIFVAVSLPVVIYTGILEWKRKYNQASTGVFKLKIAAAVFTSIGTVACLAWRLAVPGVIFSESAPAFLLVCLGTLAAAGIAGHIGGKLVFKD